MTGAGGLGIKPRGRIYGPPGFDATPYIRALAHGAFLHFQPGGARFRRESCRYSPILFALTYLRPTLRKGIIDPSGKPAITFSEFHLAAYADALRWTRPGQPYAQRDAWLASRGSGKSSTFFLILAIWALAYGHRRFIIAVADVSSIAEEHLTTLRDELATNPRLRADFPKLCTPRKSNTREYVASTGAAITVRGLDAGMVGLKKGNDRPDLILMDDGEGVGRYSLDKKTSRLNTLLVALLPLDETRTAPVQFIGTTTMYGSILHDILIGAEWAKSERFRVRHFPALITDPVTGEQRSSWPHKWSLARLLYEQDKYGFDLNFQCLPGKPGGTFWKPEDIALDEGWKVTNRVDRKVLAIDPAVTSRSSSDQTGIALLGYASSKRTWVVLRAAGYHLDPAALKARVDSILADDRDIREVVVEENNGHDFVLAALDPLPSRVKMYGRTTRPNKAERFGILLSQYQRGRVLHAEAFPALTRQMFTVTGGTEDDDIIDSVTLAWEHMRDHPPFIDAAEEHLRKRGGQLARDAGLSFPPPY